MQARAQQLPSDVILSFCSSARLTVVHGISGRVSGRGSYGDCRVVQSKRITVKQRDKQRPEEIWVRACATVRLFLYLEVAF